MFAFKCFPTPGHADTSCPCPRMSLVPAECVADMMVEYESLLVVQLHHCTLLLVLSVSSDDTDSSIKLFNSSYFVKVTSSLVVVCGGWTASEKPVHCGMCSVHGRHTSSKKGPLIQFQGLFSGEGSWLFSRGSEVGTFSEIIPSR